MKKKTWDQWLAGVVALGLAIFLICSALGCSALGEPEKQLIDQTLKGTASISEDCDNTVAKLDPSMGWALAAIRGIQRKADDLHANQKQLQAVVGPPKNPAPTYDPKVGRENRKESEESHKGSPLWNLIYPGLVALGAFLLDQASARYPILSIAGRALRGATAAAQDAPDETKKRMSRSHPLAAKLLAPPKPKPPPPERSLPS